MNKFKKASAIILVFCTAAALFTACDKKDDTSTDITSAFSVSDKIQEELKTELTTVAETNESIVASANTNAAATVSSSEKLTKATLEATQPTTKKRNVSNDKVEEKAVGISMLSKSDPVKTGNHASIIIQGTPGKTYTIEFYDSINKKASYSELTEKTADENGFVSWSFKIRNSCDLGTRKIIIKENNSDNYLQTSITVN